MSSIWPLRRATRSGTHDNVPSSSSPNESNQPKKTKKKEKKGAKKNKEGAFVLSGPTNAQHLGHMGFDLKNGFEIRNLPPEWEALFTGHNDTLKSLGAHGITKKEAQMLFAMASDALSAPGSTTARTPAAPSTAPAKPEKPKKEDRKKKEEERRKAAELPPIQENAEFKQLLNEREELIKEKNQWQSEREVLIQEKQTFSDERDSWAKSKETSQTQHQKLHDENASLWQQLQDEKKLRSRLEMENAQLSQRIRTLEHEEEQLRAQLFSKSSETESHSKRHDSKIVELMTNYEAVIERKEKELTYEREYRSQLQVEKIELENQLAQDRAEILSLKAQSTSPSTIIEEAKKSFDAELEAIKKRLEDDMNQTKQLLAYEQQCRAFYEESSRRQDSEVFKLKAQLEERLEAEKEWDEEKSRLVEKLKTQHEKSAEEIQGMLAKITQATERALQLEHNLHEKDDQLASATEEKEKLLDKLRSLNEQLEREIREKKELMAKKKKVADEEGPTTVPQTIPDGPSMPPPGPPPPPAAAVPPRAPAAPPRAPAAPSLSADGLEANSRDALLAAIKNPGGLLRHVDPKSKEKQDTASEDGNVLNIIARALLARRTAIKDDEENEDEELWE